MLREATNGGFAKVRSFPVRRFHFSAGAVEAQRFLGPGEMAAIERLQAVQPVAVADAGRRRYWWFQQRFWWEDELLEAEDVMALLIERERQARRRLDRAHALMAGESAPPLARTAITAGVKRVVWERCGGRCTECGSAALLEFDHVIPLAMGGSSTERNLQLLCADCNRLKGAAM